MTTDSVQIFVRLRPKNKAENAEVKKAKASGKPLTSFWKYNDEHSISLANPKDPPKAKKTQFTFDHVFLPASTQSEVYDRIIDTEALFNGVNTAAMFYGQSGSGKTHTAMGDLDDESMWGVTPRIVRDIFRKIDSSDTVCAVKASYIEIYAENIRDLLKPGNDNLRIREVTGKKGKKKGKPKKYTYIEGCTARTVDSYEETMEIVRSGNINRTSGSTKLNDQSSRSHSIFILDLSQNDVRNNTRTSSKLYIVDLAGSEQVKKTEASGTRLDEAKYINKSLSALRNVTSALTTGKEHVPYRDSKLTYLLRDTLGGNSRTSILVTASPSRSNQRESWNTVRFGVDAKNMPNTPIVNQVFSIETYKRLVAELQERNAFLEAEVDRLHIMYEPDGVRRVLEPMPKEASDISHAIVDQVRSPPKKVKRLRSIHEEPEVIPSPPPSPPTPRADPAEIASFNLTDVGANDEPLVQENPSSADPVGLGVDQKPDLLRAPSPVHTDVNEDSEVDPDDSTDSEMDFYEETDMNDYASAFSNDVIVFGDTVVRMKTVH